MHGFAATGTAASPVPAPALGVTAAQGWRTPLHLTVALPRPARPVGATCPFPVPPLTRDRAQLRLLQYPHPPPPPCCPAEPPLPLSSSLPCDGCAEFTLCFWPKILLSSLLLSVIIRFVFQTPPKHSHNLHLYTILISTAPECKTTHQI